MILFTTFSAKTKFRTELVTRAVRIPPKRGSWARLDEEHQLLYELYSLTQKENVDIRQTATGCTCLQG